MRTREIKYLSQELWAPTGSRVRSRELTPLYVDRFNGPCAGVALTTHNFWEMIVMAGGRGVLDGEKPVDLTVGTVCLVPPGTAHVERASDPVEIVWIGLVGSRIEAVELKQVTVAHIEEGPRLARRMWDIATRDHRVVGPQLDGMALMLFDSFLQSIESTEQAEHKRIEHAIDYLRANFNDDIIVSDVADACGYSEGYFYRKFKEVTGRTPIQYLAELRIEEAKRWLVHSDLPIGEIAVHVGFVNTHYFSRVFRETAGASASEFRSRARSGQANRALAKEKPTRRQRSSAGHGA